MSTKGGGATGRRRVGKVRVAAKPPGSMSKKELMQAVIDLRQANGELHSQMAGLRYALGKSQKKIKAYRLANETRKLVFQASQRSGRPPVDVRPWATLGPERNKEEEVRAELMNPILASRTSVAQSAAALLESVGSGMIATAPLFRSPSIALLDQRAEAREASAFGGGAPRVPRQKKASREKPMQFGELLIDMEPLAPSKLKSMLKKETSKDRKYQQQGRNRRPKSAQPTSRQRRAQIMNGAPKMTEEQAQVHMATMDMPFAKLTMDPRLRKNREKRMSKRRQKKKAGKTHADGVPSWSRAEHTDVTSMFMVKR
jgi:hypothetical protein